MCGIMGVADWLGGGLIKAAAGAYSTFANRRAQVKAEKHEFRMAELKAKTEAASQGRGNEAKWNETSIQKAGWQPGFLTIVLSMPMILV